jgi:hypothetical protein
VNRRHAIALLGACLAAAACGSGAYGADAHGADASVAVLDFELNDLTLDPNNPAEKERTASIKRMLEEALAARPGLRTVPVEAVAQASADAGVGYLFDHPEAAAALGRAAGADWVVVGRVHKASFLFVYFKVHLVDAKSGELAADLVVEVKGPQKALTRRGVESLAQQIAAAIEQRSGAVSAHDQAGGAAH